MSLTLSVSVLLLQAGADGKIAPAKRYNQVKRSLSQRQARITQKLTKRGIVSLKPKKAAAAQ